MNDHNFEFGPDWISPYFPLWNKLLPHDGVCEVLEVGCFEGRATVWFLERWPDCFVTCIDTFEGGHDHKQLGLDFSDVERRFYHNTSPWQGRIKLLIDTSASVLRGFCDARFDIIFIDGSHMAADVFTDIALTWPLLSSGGILILDDYGWGMERPLHERPAPAINAFLKCFYGQYELLEKGYQCIVRKH